MQPYSWMQLKKERKQWGMRREREREDVSRAEGSHFSQEALKKNDDEEEKNLDLSKLEEYKGHVTLLGKSSSVKHLNISGWPQTSTSKLE